MNPSVTPAPQHSTAPESLPRQHTPLSAITASTGRMTDVLERRPIKPITFDSAL
ncbi:hypothetical protein ACFWA4_15295 [Streptomyces sp. NPDC060011]|uniref:hypothetical protein n=1 Tax=unclassified Streptomyces TaxID=2593676 RepID=UPI0013BAE510|nr:MULTISPECIES: hypothetical protein [unclassified Streptomyces]MCX4914573.1 hypothetical protein [Streptomyces sp. NBC_00687]MCX5133329.1 hypothetical protein [Streptomyces sp. NBC_00340]MCX5283166.1 hypothetical protein [Streptomyces sp. NBC_00198]NEB29528.1 hypothetical protein [Streptomyces sp. SID14446]WSD79848.1 hypothetical protein OHB33_28010 [Streptomyces sp. NBC_01558]